MKAKFINLKKAFNHGYMKVACAAALASGQIASTMCVPTTGIPALDNLTTLIMKLMMWGGFILLAAGVAMTAKAIMDSVSGQGQPGGLGKGLAMAAGGAILLAIEVVMAQLGA